MSDTPSTPMWLSAVVEMRPPSEDELKVAEDATEEAAPIPEVPAEVKLDQPQTPHAGAGHTHKTAGIKITPA
ncbi:MAG TPA: hypothetical protein VFO65_13480, partial [Acidimicrobiales bacterium]|nr:hypothetical protein [Acidimicrobiales bacterium]